MQSKLVKLAIGTLEIPTSIIDMINGKGQFVIMNHFFKDSIKTESIYNATNIFEDKDTGNSKAIINISGIYLLYKRPQNGLYTQDFVYVLSDSLSTVDSERFTFRAPYTEATKRKKSLECKCSNEELMMKLCKFENIIMYTLDFLILAEFLEVPKEAITSARTDKELIENFFNAIYSESDKKKNIPYKYFSERYFDCIRDPPIWMKEDKKFHIQAVEDELDGLDRVKYCTLSEVIYKSLPEAKRKELMKKHPRVYKNWFSMKQLIIPQTKRIVYEKKQTEVELRTGEPAKLAEYLSNVLKLVIKFDKTDKNIADKLARKIDSDRDFIQFVTDHKKTRKLLEFSDYLSLYNGKSDFVENEPLESSMQTWSGKIVCKIEFTTILFSLGYPKIESSVRCLIINKAELPTNDDFADLIDEAEAEVEADSKKESEVEAEANSKKENEAETKDETKEDIIEDVDQDEY